MDGKRPLPAVTISKAEGGLKSEADVIQNQADQSKVTELGNDLLQSANTVNSHS
jgi:hypothetical protein